MEEVRTESVDYVLCNRLHETLTLYKAPLLKAIPS